MNNLYRKKSGKRSVYAYAVMVVCFVSIAVTDPVYAKTNGAKNHLGGFLSQAKCLAKDCHFSLQANGRIRKYNVHLPYGFQLKKNLPVVIFLHGGGGSIKGAYQEGLHKASDKYGFILVVPAGSGVYSEALLTWNAGEWEGGKCCGWASDHAVDDVSFISRIIDDLKIKFDIDEKQIFVTGISNGAMMAYRLACELSGKIAAVAAVAPPAVPQGCAPSRPVSIMHIIGTADPCVPYQGGEGKACLNKVRFKAQSAEEMVSSWRQMNSCSDSVNTSYQNGKATCIAYESCGRNSAVEFCTMEGAGHTWPSGRQYLSKEKVGTVSFDLSFHQIWEFFKKHPLSE